MPLRLRGSALRFPVMIYCLQGDYSAMVPDLPGCVAVAETVEKVRDLIAEAVVLHLDLMRQSGEAIPTPTQHLDFTIDEDTEEEFCTWVEVKLTAKKKHRHSKAG